MKETHILCAAGILAVIAIVAILIGYVTDTLPKHTQRVITISPPVTETPVITVNTANTSTPEAIEKPCHCCDKTMAKLRSVVESIGKKSNITQDESPQTRDN